MKEKQKKNKGITLIALVITIIVLLILAGVTIVTLTGDNGLLTKAGEAKNATEIANEKEQIQLAYTNAILNNKMSNDTISKSMQDELTGKFEDIQIDEFGNVYLITIDKERYYTIRDGKIIEGKNISGLYSNGIMSYSWQELIENNYLTEVNGELTSGYVNTNNHPNTEFIEGTLVIDERITKIGNNGLRALSNMTEVYFPKTLQSIGSDALIECTNLKNIYVDENNENYTSENGVLFNKDKTKLCIYPNMNGTKYIIPNSVTEISGKAFYGCTNLQEIEIPNSVTKLGWWAFYSCTGLKEIDIPGSIKQIGYYTFDGCSSVKNITISEGVTDLMSYAFTGTSITSVTIPESVKNIEAYVFAESKQLTEVNLPSNLKSVGYCAFGSSYTWNANKLESVTYKNTKYFGSSTLFEAFRNNEVTFSNACFNLSPFAD